ncbi:hypothetical protein ACW2QC_09240 [Virgibacillus sp. FSP13]
MTEKQAYSELEKCLRNNKTITISKLKKLLTALEMDINAIKGASNLRMQNKKLRKKIARLKG